jgi:hypothetical protein
MTDAVNTTREKRLTERRLYELMSGRYEKIREESHSDRHSQKRHNETAKTAWKKLLASLGIEFHDAHQPKKPEIFYVTDPDERFSLGFKLLAVPEETALKILTLGLP